MEVCEENRAASFDGIWALGLYEVGSDGTGGDLFRQKIPEGELMGKSNHQKHGFVILSKAFRRDKVWVVDKKFIRKIKKSAIWNGRPYKGIFRGEVGRVESIRLIEAGG
jgi:hypothetical protein